MLRQLLTLLALVSGLGLATTPAVVAQASVVSVAAAGDTQDCQAITSQPLEFLRGAPAGTNRQRPCSQKAIIVWTPTVQLKVDRARE